MKRVQAVAGQIGWALAAEGSGLAMPLLVTVDGGRTWHEEVTAQVRAAYVNGKLSSAHMAIDVAAPTGTPLKATNDGA